MGKGKKDKSTVPAAPVRPLRDVKSSSATADAQGKAPPLTLGRMGHPQEDEAALLPSMLDSLAKTAASQQKSRAKKALFRKRYSSTKPVPQRVGDKQAQPVYNMTGAQPPIGDSVALQGGCSLPSSDSLEDAVLEFNTRQNG